MIPGLSVEVITDEIKVPNYIKERSITLNILFILSFDTLKIMKLSSFRFYLERSRVKVKSQNY